MRLTPAAFGFSSRRACLCLVGWALSVGALAAEGVTVVRDLPYLEAGRAEKLDLYLPDRGATDGPVPAVVWIHGGDWVGGDKGEARAHHIGEALADAGYVCVSINYRLGDRAWPTNLLDCKNAVRFLRVHAADYHVDPHRIAAFGGSAGAELALMVAFTGDHPAWEPGAPYAGVSSAVSCALDFYGPADFPAWRKIAVTGAAVSHIDRAAEARVFAAGDEADSARWREVSPVTYVTPASPPILIAHGLADPLVDSHQSVELDQILTAHGVAHQTILLPGVGHSFDLTSEGSRPLPEDLTPAVLAFLRDHLGAAPHGTPVMTFPATPRVSVDLDAGWKFYPRDNTHGPEPAFDDSSWDKVDLPHTWNAADGADGGNNYYRGPAWYRRHVTVDPRLAGKRLYLQFDGVSLMADVYVNGNHVGNHQGGFGRFRFDVTDSLHPGADNLIAVRADNGRIGIIPISADFTFFGGIYRPVSLLATDQVQISTMDYGSQGVFVTQDSVSAGRADLTVRAEVECYEDKAQTVEVVTQLRGRQNEVIQTFATKRRMAAGDAFENSQRISLEHPHLWDGRADPYLYSMSVILRVGGVVRDAVTVPLGLRFFRVDPAGGFMLNGHPLDLHGVNRHQDRQGKGWAISPADEAEDFSILQEIGASAIRVSHYQQAETWYQRLDRAGIIAWAEIPFVGNALTNPEFLPNAKLQLRELIRQNYNHPAICFWSVGNETRDLPADSVIAALANEVTAEDSTRLSTYASDAKPDDPKNWHTDVVAFNHYAGWYVGDYDSLGAWLDALHISHAKAAVGISEYGAGGSIVQHDDSRTPPAPKGPWHPEEYQARLHEASWLALEQRPFIWGKFVWCLFDFACDTRNEGDHPGRNDKGLVTYDRQTRKDAFFWYRANWNPAPLVYLTDRRFTERAKAETEIKVYATAPEVEVTLNGKSLGIQRSADHRFIWPGVALEPGVNHVTATGHFGDQVITDACTWELKLAPAARSAPPSAKHD
jgi:beta-galactosidase